MDKLYFDHLKVGQRFQSDGYKITADAIIAFARDFDVQPFHTDPEAAKESVFKGHAASGWHTAAIAMRLFTTGPLQFVGGCVGLGVDELRWPVAVRPNDTLQLETEILELRVSRSKPQHGIMRIRNVLRNQNGEVVLSYMANAMAQRRSSQA
ncbi:MAG TPA: MaoC family dehydratase [Chthoniobacterales bacterium]|nr:MaoC family dehydratase [Chthoniobacterales bacterium]